jgi:teichuronic acid biosynthesis glycosyltransferase TuaC
VINAKSRTVNPPASTTARVAAVPAKGSGSLRVLVVTGMYPTPARPNYGVFIAEQVRALRTSGIDVDVIAPDLARSRLQYVSIIPELARRLRSGGYDLVHTHHTYTFWVVQAARMAARYRIPIVLTNHEGEALDREGRGRTWHPTSRLRHARWLKRRAAEAADFTIFVSRQLAAAIAPRAAYAVIPCGVDLQKFRSLERAGCRRRLGIPLEARVVFFPNTPTGAGKRFSLVRAAFDLLRAAVGDAILLTGGGIAYEDMPSYYNAADVILQASYYEASPTIVKEALACEVPLVSTDVGDTREIIEGVPPCVVCQDDPNELAHHARACLGARATGGPARLRALGLAAEQVAARVGEVYRHVCNGKRGL